MNKEEFLKLFKQCVEDGDIKIKLTDNLDYDGNRNIYTRASIKHTRKNILILKVMVYLNMF